MKGSSREGVGGRGGDREDGVAVRSRTRRRLGPREPEPVWPVAISALSRPGNLNAQRSLGLISALATEGAAPHSVGLQLPRPAVVLGAAGGKGVCVQHRPSSRWPAEVRVPPSEEQDCGPRGTYVAATANAAPPSSSYPDGKKLPVPTSPQRAKDVFRRTV